MEPSAWTQIETQSSPGNTSTYALVDALLQFREKFEREMTACNLATGPIIFVGAWNSETGKTISQQQYENLAEAMQVVWPDSRLVDYDSLLAEMNNPVAAGSGEKTQGVGHRAGIQLSGERSSTISLLDRNFKLFQLFRLVLREELRMFTRVTDADENALFVDEFSVSPTILVDPAFSPLGGFFFRLEKNSSRPLVADFGPIHEGGEHVLRFNDSFHQPSATPPIFNSTPVKEEMR